MLLSWMIACAAPEQGGIPKEGEQLPSQCEPDGAVGSFSYTDVGEGVGLLDTDDDDPDGQDQGAVAMADFDGDGDDDLLISNRHSGVWYQENVEGSLTLQSVLPVQDIVFIGVVDIENDGDLDWIAGGRVPEMVMMENDGAAGFTDITEDAGINVGLIRQYKRHASFADFNLDGLLDIFISTSRDTDSAPDAGDATRQHQLLLNLGGRFENVTEWLPTESVKGNGWDSVWTDYDQDGDLDLYVAHSDQDRLPASTLLSNGGPGEGGAWVFSDASADCHCVETGPTMGVAAGDFDDDGWPDLFVNATGPNHMLWNAGDATFVDITAAVGAHGTDELRVMSFGNVVADLDNNGTLDAFLTTGPLKSGGIETQPDDQPDQLLLQNGDGTFTESAAAAGVADIGVGRGAAMGLFNADGYPDLAVVSIGDPSRLYVAPCMAGRALIVDLVGVRANRFGVGASLIAHVSTPDGSAEGEITLHREVGNNVGWGGSSHPRAWFGLGEGVVERLEIRWPSGVVQEIEPDPSALRITVEEPSP